MLGGFKIHGIADVITLALPIAVRGTPSCFALLIKRHLSLIYWYEGSGEDAILHRSL